MPFSTAMALLSKEELIRLLPFVLSSLSCGEGSEVSVMVKATVISGILLVSKHSLKVVLLHEMPPFVEYSSSRVGPS